MLQTENGQRFLQYGYSFGAAIVIFGAMVKVLHLWGIWGNIIFGTGMAIECVVFVLYGFDRPPQVSQSTGNSSIVLADDSSGVPAQIVLHGAGTGQPVHVGGNAGQSTQSQPTVATSSSASTAQQSIHVSESGNAGDIASVSDNVNKFAEATEALSKISESLHQRQPTQPQPIGATSSAPIVEQTQPTQSSTRIPEGDYIGQIASVSDNVHKFAEATETLTRISESLQQSYQHIIDNSQNISENSLGYVQQMEALNRNISGLNTIYEIQLKGISGQLDTIEQINQGLARIKSMYSESIPDSSVIKQETEKMAEQIRELNQIYGRMIEAMTNK